MVGFFSKDKMGYNDEQLRALTVCCILMINNVGSDGVLMFAYPKSKDVGTPEETKKMLQEWWGIEDRDEAINVMEYLSTADGHTPVANEIYSNLIGKGKFELLDGNTFDAYNEFELLARNSLERAENQLPDFMEENNIPQEDVEEAFQVLAKIIFINRVNNALAGYLKTVEFLKKYGYTIEEINKIRNLSAWDYGRCGMIVRNSAHSGYIQESEGWKYMLAAGENAANTYKNWREFFAAYFLGRAIAYGSDDLEDNWGEIAEYLLESKSSPYQKIKFKLLHVVH